MWYCFFYLLFHRHLSIFLSQCDRLFPLFFWPLEGRDQRHARFLDEKRSKVEQAIYKKKGAQLEIK